MPEPWRRHDLLRVEPGAWSRTLLAGPQPSACPHVTQWAARGWPLIVRRSLPGDDLRRIPVGLPLPPAEGKGRFAAQIAPEEVSAWLPPLTLRETRDAAPPAWSQTIDALLRLAERIGIEPQVFGSLLWQRLTGLLYLSSNSDLDLLWPVLDPATADELVGNLARIDRDGPVRCDGEILLPDSSGVQWREWHGASAEVLVKTAAGVELRAKRDVFAPAACLP